MIKILKLLFIPIFACLMCSVTGQTPAEFQANYAKRIKLEMINGVYIPIDLEDAFSELNRLSDAKGISNFKNAPDSLIAKSHFGLVKWVQLNWGLDEGSRFSDYLKRKGISLPDDMARVIVLMYHRKLNGQPLMFEEEVAKIAKRMDAEKMKRDSSRVIIFLEKKPHKE